MRLKGRRAMHVINARQYFLDTLVELTGIKSGLAVLVPKAIELLDRNTSDPDRFCAGIQQRAFASKRVWCKVPSCVCSTVSGLLAMRKTLSCYS